MSSFSCLIAPARTSSTMLNRRVKIHLILVLRVAWFQFFIVYKDDLLDGVTDSVDMSLSRVVGVGDAQGSMICCSPWRCNESDMTE